MTKRALNNLWIVNSWKNLNGSDDNEGEGGKGCWMIQKMEIENCFALSTIRQEKSETSVSGRSNIWINFAFFSWLQRNKFHDFNPFLVYFTKMNIEISHWTSIKNTKIVVKIGSTLERGVVC